MRTSEFIKEIAAALNKAQAEIINPELNKVNPFHKSRYCDLPETIRCMKEAFARHGLSVVQSPGDANGVPILETRVMHLSGEWIETVTPLIMPGDKATMQSLGGCITYARRYALAALCNVAAEDDDDGNAVSTHKPANNEYKPYTASKEAPKAQSLNDIDNEIGALILALKAAESENVVSRIKAQATALRNRASMSAAQIKSLTMAINEAVERVEGRL